jgi:predicted  nucleic acid-binding Zn-ribbon protein
MKKQVNFKLPEELIKTLQERAAQERLSATDLVIQGMSLFLGIVDPSQQPSQPSLSLSDIAERIEVIEERLDKIEAAGRFNFMYQSLSQASDIDIRIDSEAVELTERIDKLEQQIVNLTQILEEVQAQNQMLRDRNAVLESLGH